MGELFTRYFPKDKLGSKTVFRSYCLYDANFVNYRGLMILVSYQSKKVNLKEIQQNINSGYMQV